MFLAITIISFSNYHPIPFFVFITTSHHHQSTVHCGTHHYNFSLLFIVRRTTKLWFPCDRRPTLSNKAKIRRITTRSFFYSTVPSPSETHYNLLGAMKSIVVGIVVSVLLLNGEVQNAAAFFGKRSFIPTVTKGGPLESDNRLSTLSGSGTPILSLSKRTSYWPPRGGGDGEGESPVAEEEPEILYLPGLLEVELVHTDQVRKVAQRRNGRYFRPTSSSPWVHEFSSPPAEFLLLSNPSLIIFSSIVPCSLFLGSPPTS